MNSRQLLWILLIGGAALWLWKSGRVTKDATPPKAVPGSAASAAVGPACVSAAEEAGRKVQSVSAVLLRTPIDPSAYASAASAANDAISAADSACGAAGSPADEKAMDEARGALSEMRALLSDLGAALAGTGSASEAPRRQETIDTKLSAARAAL
jgi:hypothetical protein